MHSVLASDSEIDDEKFDRHYEELLTFETHEDERREQRLLKALSDIAAKAKQKIQSIITESEISSMANDRSKAQHEALLKAANSRDPKEPKYLNHSARESAERKATRHSEDRYSSDYSPKSRASSKKSRKEEEGNGNRIGKST